MKNSKVELTILSGFLGSGKSTLLARLLEEDQALGKKVGVIMNELGEVSIDSSFVPYGTPLKELLNGCICCSIQGELSLQLAQMLSEYELDVIYIEATGAAHPIEIVDACTHPSLAYRTHIRAVVSVVDAKQWEERNQLKSKVRKLIEEQVKFADVVLFNKIDKIEPDGVEPLKAEVRERNPRAQILDTSFSQIDPSILRGVQPSLERDPHTPTHAHHHLHLRTFSQKLEGPLDRMRFEKWIKKLPGPIYRGKGFVHVSDSAELYLFQFAYGEIMLTPLRPERPIQPMLVIIGEELDHKQMEEDLRELQSLSSVDKYKY